LLYEQIDGVSSEMIAQHIFVEIFMI